jgi:hypothetical protein
LGANNVFTVILLSRAAKERYLLWKEVFEPYRDGDRIAICDWNPDPGVRNINEAVPDLAEIIKGKEEWRLVAVGTATEGRSGIDFADPENPFDYIRNWQVQDEPPLSRLSLKESPYPLVRLSHLLLGYPEMGTNTFFRDVNYLDRTLRKRVYESDFVDQRESEGVTREDALKEFAALLVEKHDVQVHYHQKVLSEDEDREYRKLIRKYEVRQSAPTEVILVAQRDPKPQRPTDELRAAWQHGDKAEHSQFVSRNDYHPACRFVVFDLHAEDHSAFELGELKFWISLLTMAINDLPASSFQAERLYRIDVGFDDDIFAHMLNEHMSRLASARDRLNREIAKPRVAITLDVKDLLQERPVDVSFEHLSGESLRVSTDGYGLASDKPVREFSRWEESHVSLLSAAEQFARKPRRVLAQAVDGMRNSRDLPDFPDQALSRIEHEELEEELSERARHLSDATTREILDPGRLAKIIESEKKTIRRILRERMTYSTILLSSLFVGGVWFAVFIPFIIAAYNSGGWALPESLLVVAIVLAGLGAVAVGTLVYMRHKLIRRLRALNDALGNYVKDVKNKASAFGDFLGSVRTYMYGRALLDADAHKEVVDRRRNQEYLRDLRRIQKIIEREKSLVRSVNKSVEIKQISNLNLDLVVWSPQRLRELLELPPSTPGNMQCLFSASGDRIEAPYDFVARLALSDLVLLEDHVRHRRIIEDEGIILTESVTDL